MWNSISNCFFKGEGDISSIAYCSQEIVENTQMKIIINDNQNATNQKMNLEYYAQNEFPPRKVHFVRSILNSFFSLDSLTGKTCTKKYKKYKL